MCLLVGCKCGAERTYGPNVILVVVDTVRADHLGLYGYERQTDDELKRFADSATVFSRAYSHAPWTKPSVATMLTSRLPREHGVGAWEDTLPEDVLTLPEVLKEAGYRTEAYVSHHALSPEMTRLDRGFDVYDISAYEGTDPHKAVNAPKVTNLAIEALDAQTPEQPFFFWLHYFDPHNYYRKHDAFVFGNERIDRYDGEIANTDLHLGRLLKYIEDSGHWQDTIVIITSDHGEAFGEHGIHLHTKDLHNELIRVPLVIRVPGLKPSREEHSVGHMALTPTILSLLGLPIPEDFAGETIGVSRGRLTLDDHRLVLSSTTHEADKRSAVLGDDKVIRDLENDSWLFYDLAKDPREVAGLEPEEASASLREELELELARPTRAVEKAALDAEQREILEKLGYVEGDEE